MLAQKKLRITTGSVKRLQKELKMYMEEYEHYTKTIEQLQDEYDIKKHKELAEESNSMVKDTKSRLNKAVVELKSLVELADEGEEKLAAIEVMK